MTADEFKKLCTTAEGYIELGLLEDALKTLEGLPMNLKITKQVILLHVQILMRSGQMLKASYLAENLSFSNPDNLELAIEVARLKHIGGENTEALKWLHSVELKCQHLACLHLLRARCHAALEDLEACVLALRATHDIEPAQRLRTIDDPPFDAIYGKERPAAKP